jgi:hypothetical protein
MDARTKTVIVQGDEGKFLAKEKIFGALAFWSRPEAQFAARGKFCLLPSVGGIPVLFAGWPQAYIEDPSLTRSTPSAIAILYAPDKHYCWAFFDIRNEKYALDRRLARH